MVEGVVNVEEEGGCVWEGARGGRGTKGINMRKLICRFFLEET